MTYKVGDIVTYPVHVFAPSEDGKLKREPGYIMAEILNIDTKFVVVQNLHNKMIVGLRIEALSAQHPL